MAKKMRAVQVPRAGGALELVERDIAEPQAGWVRIKVDACGVCHSDSLIKEGLWPGIQYPRIPGHEVIGVIDAVGPDVPDWKSGQRVGVGWHASHCGHCDPCRRGDFFACQVELLTTGISFDGGYAEYMVAPAKALASVQDDLNAVVGGLSRIGTLVVIAAAGPLSVDPILMITGQRAVKGWYSGTSIDSQDTLQFSASNGVQSMNEIFPLDRAAEAYDRMMSGKARFRVVLQIGES